jgi:transposase
METNIAQNVGVDICKATLDVHLHPAGIARQFTNDPNGLEALLCWLGDRHVTRVVFEPTGRYHHDFERHLGRAGLALAKVNPRQARRFAEAIGCNAKTDAVDAAMLARMGALLELPCRPIASHTLDTMTELQVARLGLVKDRTAAKNREHVCRSPLLKRQAAQRLAQIDRQIAAIDAELKASLTSEPDLTARFNVLVSIPGIGEIRQSPCLSKCPSLVVLKTSRSRRCPGSLQSLATADSIAASAISGAVAPNCDTLSTCRRSWRPGSTPI